MEISAKNYNVLFVDDQDHLIQSLKRSLSEEPFGQYFTTDVKEALKIIDNTNIHVIVTDYLMPELNGFKLLEEVKKRKPFIVGVMMTASRDLDTAVKGLNTQNVFRYLLKPFSSEDNLVPLLQESFSHYALIEENKMLFESTVETKNALENKNRELEKMVESKNQLLNMIAHDIRSPLLSTSLALECFFSKNTDKKIEMVKMKKHILDGIKHLHGLLDDLLTLNKWESGRIGLRKSKADICNLLHKTLSGLQAQCEAKNIEIMQDIKTSGPEAFIDTVKIQQVFENFITNAIKYSHKNSKVHITAYIKKKVFYFEIKDHGVGIKDEDKSKIFKIYGTTTSRPTDNEKSTGLGLMIAKNIIESHGGTTGFTSVYQEGSVFYFNIPIYSQEM